MATLISQALQDKIEILVAPLRTKVASFQAAYLATNNRYIQCLSTHAEIPKDGIKDPVNLKTATADFNEKWEDVGASFPATLEFNIWMDVYETPKKEWGYVLGYEVEESAKRWVKEENTGPETKRDHDWEEQDFPT